MNKIQVAIHGYGNLGRGVELALSACPDMELVGVFTRRDPGTVTPAFPETRVFSTGDLSSFREKIDVLILCGGSATDLPTATPLLAKEFCVVDSFDTHARIPGHFDAVDAAAREGEKLALISAGWDPGMFSLNRLYAEAILPCGKDYTFWGRGVSQGHSDAIRRIDGVVDARQYTVPVESAMASVRRGEAPELSTADKHVRECYVVAEEGADLACIERKIKTMPNYFADYHTTVNFISLEELREKHSGIPHGGSVIRTGATGKGGEHTAVIEYRLDLGSNPEFTAGVLVAYARATARLYKKGERGCRTVFDIPPAALSPMSPEELRKNLL